MKNVVMDALYVLLRVPGLFMAEALYRTESDIILKYYVTFVDDNLKSEGQELLNSLYFGGLVLCLLLVVSPVILPVYLLMISSLMSAYVTVSQRSVMTLVVILMMQVLLSSLFAYTTKSPRRPLLLFLLLMVPLPTLANMSGVLSATVLRQILFKSTFVALSAYVYVTFSFTEDLIRKYGTGHVFLTFLISRIRLPLQFMLFWCTMFGSEFYKNITDNSDLTDDWSVVFLNSIGENCVTPLSILGFCATVSCLASVLLVATQFVLPGRGIFNKCDFILQRLVMCLAILLHLCNISILVETREQMVMTIEGLLQMICWFLLLIMSEVTHPITVALGMTQNRSPWNHIRVHAVIMAILAASIYLFVHVMQLAQSEEWSPSLVVIVCCMGLAVPVKLMGSLIIYVLSMCNDRSSCYKLNDVVRRVNFTVYFIYFVVFSVFCIGIGHHLSVRKSFWVWGLIWCVHGILVGVFALWLTVRECFKTGAVDNILRVLSDATPGELKESDYQCSICLEEMLRTAKRTPCGHVFHAPCLKQWLLVKASCPVCGAALDAPTTSLFGHEQGSNSAAEGCQIRERCGAKATRSKGCGDFDFSDTDTIYVTF